MLSANLDEDGAQPSLMLRPVRLRANRLDLGIQALEGGQRSPVRGPVGAVRQHAASGEVGQKAEGRAPVVVECSVRLADPTGGDARLDPAWATRASIPTSLVLQLTPIGAEGT
jgi:hypothetical protein